MTTDTLYDEDFVLWTERQAEELRRAAHVGSNLPLDWENLAEEIESVGKRDRREAESHVHNILAHILKLACSPAVGPRAGWIKEIRGFRERLERVIRDSPSLRARLDDIIAEESPRAVRDAREELELYGEMYAARSVTAERLLGVTAEHVLDNSWLPPAPSWPRGSARAEAARGPWPLESPRPLVRSGSWSMQPRASSTRWRRWAGASPTTSRCLT